MYVRRQRTGTAGTNQLALEIAAPVSISTSFSINIQAQSRSPSQSPSPSQLPSQYNISISISISISFFIPLPMTTNIESRDRLRSTGSVVVLQQAEIFLTATVISRDVGSGGDRAHLLVAVVISPFTTHPFRDGAGGGTHHHVWP